jgi:SAM-dependent methyltransferase
MCGARTATFDVVDARQLDERSEYVGTFDIVIACEVIEHVLDDRKLLKDIAACLKPGGRVLLTAPNQQYIPITESHMGPFSRIEDGGHVRKGYSKPMLAELCVQADLQTAEITFCSGLLSQKLAGLHGALRGVQPLLGWTSTFPFRALPILADRFVTRALDWPEYSICMEAYKPRFAD